MFNDHLMSAPAALARSSFPSGKLQLFRCLLVGFGLTWLLFSVVHAEEPTLFFSVDHMVNKAYFPPVEEHQEPETGTEISEGDLNPDDFVPQKTPAEVLKAFRQRGILKKGLAVSCLPEFSSGNYRIQDLGRITSFSVEEMPSRNSPGVFLVTQKTCSMKSKDSCLFIISKKRLSPIIEVLPIQPGPQADLASPLKATVTKSLLQHFRANPSELPWGLVSYDPKNDKEMREILTQQLVIRFTHLPPPHSGMILVRCSKKGEEADYLRGQTFAIYFPDGRLLVKPLFGLLGVFRIAGTTYYWGVTGGSPESGDVAYAVFRLAGSQETEVFFEYGFAD